MAVKREKLLKQSGQTMILTVLAIGGAILGATTIASLLVVFQLKQADFSADSAKAIYASDAGVEAELYEYFKNPGTTPLVSMDTSGAVLGNGASVLVKCFSDNAGTPPPVACDTSSISAKSSGVGSRSTAKRAFLLVFAAATTTFP